MIPHARTCIYSFLYRFVAIFFMLWIFSCDCYFQFTFYLLHAFIFQLYHTTCWIRRKLVKSKSDQSPYLLQYTPFSAWWWLSFWASSGLCCRLYWCNCWCRSCISSRKNGKFSGFTFTSFLSKYTKFLVHYFPPGS